MPMRGYLSGIPRVAENSRPRNTQNGAAGTRSWHQRNVCSLVQTHHGTTGLARSKGRKTATPDRCAIKRPFIEFWQDNSHALPIGDFLGNTYDLIY